VTVSVRDKFRSTWYKRINLLIQCMYHKHCCTEFFNGNQDYQILLLSLPSENVETETNDLIYAAK